MKFLDQEFPSLRPRYDRLYRKKYPPDAYRNELRGMVRMLQRRYGLAPRRNANDTDPNSSEAGRAEERRRAEPPGLEIPEQVGFAW